MRTRLNKLRNRCNVLSVSIETIKANNARAEGLKKQIDLLNDSLELSNYYSTKLHNLAITTKDRYSKFQESRIAFIENSLEGNINALFPDRGFVPKIEYEIFRNKINSALVLKDPEGNKRFPNITEGGFLQQLIGYTSAISILKLLGSKVFYIDEAFSQASGENKEKMQSIIYNTNVQMILISQSSDLYQDLPRREFRLVLDNKVCKLKSVEDFEDSFNPDIYLKEDLIESDDSKLQSNELKFEEDFSILENIMI